MRPLGQGQIASHTALVFAPIPFGPLGSATEDENWSLSCSLNRLAWPHADRRMDCMRDGDIAVLSQPLRLCGLPDELLLNIIDVLPLTARYLASRSYAQDTSLLAKVSLCYAHNRHRLVQCHSSDLRCVCLNCRLQLQRVSKRWRVLCGPDSPVWCLVTLDCGWRDDVYYRPVLQWLALRTRDLEALSIRALAYRVSFCANCFCSLQIR